MNISKNADQVLAEAEKNLDYELHSIGQQMKIAELGMTNSDLLHCLDPRSLEVIADEISGDPLGDMRAKSLRLIAGNQRAAIAKATGGAS